MGNETPVQASPKHFFVFTDASYDAKLQCGVGAALTLEESEIRPDMDDKSLKIKTKLMKTHGINRLEILTVLWAIAQLKSKEALYFQSPETKIHLFTDCQTVETLLTRRRKLEQRRFRTKSGSSELANADLYQRFFSLYDEFPFAITWIKGHTRKESRTPIERIFSRVDRKARETLRSLRD